MAAYAHSINDHGVRHDLVDHLRSVAALAAEFATPLGAKDLGYVLGLWHDIGKFSPAFQAYLAACEAEPNAHPRKVDHKAAGSFLADGELGILSLLIRGHHGGLDTRDGTRTWLADHKNDAGARDALTQAQQAIPDLHPSAQPGFPPNAVAAPTGAELFLRLLFSALVDADYLDTERHFSSGMAAMRLAGYDLEPLWERFAVGQREVARAKAGALQETREAIFRACVASAEQPTGVFRLAVPTGGGKTLSGMAFALRHAMRHGQKRVIVAVPFISITTQTADVYRHAFADNDTTEPIVLEHHSAVEGRRDEDGDPHRTEVWRRLASENWDAPIVVTTTVQLFESLFANETSPTRKLHRLANSVIIVDEVQSLPVHLLGPILDAVKELAAHYNTSVVLSTATQPAFDEIQEFSKVEARDIIPSGFQQESTLKRVEYVWKLDPQLPWSEVASLMAAAPRSLAIVNTKKDAIALLDALDDSNALHLSTLLCGAHRHKVIDEVKRRLQAGEPCRLVSTQVVEAGVDLDFPIVLRALAPLEAIIQAAGRCNREGKLRRGQVIVFLPVDGGMPPGYYRTATQTTLTLLNSGNRQPDEPDLLQNYFHRVYQSVPTDRERIQPDRSRLEYPTVARKFRMIEDDTESVIIMQYGTDDDRSRVGRLVKQLRRGTPSGRELLRMLQPYTVSLRKREAEKYRRRGNIAEIQPGLGEWLGEYDPIRGLVADVLDIERLVI
ncbi:MAG TPA: CRISPR-associated helicase Cas3' [Chloroflexota bacterium]|nr:CRISPR-associated helicase Cas3' [Chloroflexota bacterium]